MTELRNLVSRYILGEIDYDTFRPKLVRLLSAGGASINTLSALVERQCAELSDGTIAETAFKQRIADILAPSLAWFLKSDEALIEFIAQGQGTSTGSDCVSIDFFGRQQSTNHESIANVILRPVAV